MPKKNRENKSPISNKNDMAKVFEGNIRKTDEIPVVASATAIKYHSGPLPEASELEAYEHILPGAADRIFNLVEAQAKHRQEEEKSIVKTDNFISICGLMFGFLSFLLPLLLSVFLIVNGHGEYVKWF